MFGIGTPELLVILVLALVVVGPQRLPELGRTLGRALREFRKVQDDVRDMVQTGLGSELDEVRSEIRGAANELKKTTRDLAGGIKDATDVKQLFPKSAHRPRGAMSEPQSPKAPGEAAPQPATDESPTGTGPERASAEPDDAGDAGQASSAD